MITRMNHTGFVVRDLEKAVEFYRDVMGLKVSARRVRQGEPISRIVGYDDAHLNIVILNVGEGHDLELIEYLNPPAAARPTEERSILGATHLAFNVDDIQETFNTLISRGAKKLNPPTEVEPGKTACYLQDPDGNWIELIEIRG